MTLLLERLKEITGDEQLARRALKLVCDYLRDYDTGIGGEELEQVREGLLEELGLSLRQHDKEGGFDEDRDGICNECTPCTECEGMEADDCRSHNAVECAAHTADQEADQDEPYGHCDTCGKPCDGSGDCSCGGPIAISG